MLDAAAIPRVATHQHDSADSQATSRMPCYSIPRWAVVYTHPQAEIWADENLRRVGYVSYLPMMIVTRRDRTVPSMTHTVRVPLFSRYLFVRLNARAESWSPIRAAPGVSDIVRNGEDVAYAPEAAVEALQASEAARATPTQESPEWAPGAPCSLGKGHVMAGLPAVVLKASRNSVRTGIMFLGQLCEVSVPLGQLVAR